MTIYSQLQQLSQQQIQQFGQKCKVKTASNGRYNPSTGEMSLSQIEHNAYCLFDNLAFDFPSFQSSGSGKSSSVMIEQGDVMIYVTAEGKPELNSIIEVGGEKWRVIQCQPIKPADVVILYQCQGRKTDGNF